MHYYFQCSGRLLYRDSQPTSSLTMKTPEAKKTTFYLPELDLLRCGAFLLVFAFHIMPGSASGYETVAGIVSVRSCFRVSRGAALTA